MATVTYLPRSFWTDVPAGGHVPEVPINRLVVHHTVFLMEDYDRDGYLHGDLDDIRRYMIRLSEVRPDLYWLNRAEVPYSFVHFFGPTDAEGIVVEGRGWDRTGAHTANWNSKVYGCAFAGNSDLQAVTWGLIETYREIGRRLPDPLNAGRTLGHKDTKATACPGHSLYASLGLMQPPFLWPTPTPEPPKDDDDMFTRLVYQMLDDGNRQYGILGPAGLRPLGYEEWDTHYRDELAEQITNSLWNEIYKVA